MLSFPLMRAIQSSLGKNLWNLSKEESIRVLVQDIGGTIVVAFSTDSSRVASIAIKELHLIYLKKIMLIYIPNQELFTKS
ncbi:hypothetical protein NIES4071_18170 [Calothrix sp. NIES-4071]|nr:hypothetical protein NIES4071_18170 [Calothrix sp. NIES-4071]BAZ56150.1 hypothetical protein NIES4105_18120 [Calothrix sp. NIES-4105]